LDRRLLVVLPAVESDLLRWTTAGPLDGRWVVRRDGRVSLVHRGCGLCLDRLGQRRQLRSQLADLRLIRGQSGEDPAESEAFETSWKIGRIEQNVVVFPVPNDDGRGFPLPFTPQ
jgi:hypothetical protein